MGLEIVHDQRNGLGVWLIPVQQSADSLRPIDGGGVVSPRFTDHEHRAGAIADRLVIIAKGLPKAGVGSRRPATVDCVQPSPPSGVLPRQVVARLPKHPLYHRQIRQWCALEYTPVASSRAYLHFFERLLGRPWPHTPTQPLSGLRTSASRVLDRRAVDDPPRPLAVLLVPQLTCAGRPLSVLDARALPLTLLLQSARALVLSWTASPLARLGWLGHSPPCDDPRSAISGHAAVCGPLPCLS